MGKEDPEHAQDETSPEHPATGSGGAPLGAVAQAVGLAAMVGAGAIALTAWLSPGLARPAVAAREKIVLPPKKAHVDHSGMMKGPFADGPAVTRACLGCHPAAGQQMLHSEHFTWLGKAAMVPGKGGPGHESPQRIGKRNLINNFCLSIESNWPRCTSCHAGYGWKDAHFDFGRVENVDCLVCHEQTGAYRKDLAGVPVAGTNLLAAAGSVAAPTRENCGNCHFAGGGGDAVKHGDMDATLYFPRDHVDVHMGRHRMVCTDCHQTREHRIPGQSLSVDVSGRSRVACTDCHSQAPHTNDRLNQHTAAVACPTCHIPVMAVDSPTKLVWDWSTAGRDTAVKDPHRYLKEKGSFVYRAKVPPEYAWYDGTGERYLKGDRIDPARTVPVSKPHGSIRDPKARIWPFKIHRGRQPYDEKLQHLLVAQTYGPGGFWTEFDWDKALRQGAQASGVPYSGQFGFVATEMYWPIAHMVQPGERALQCTDCHGEHGRMDFEALGYDGDPAYRGGRARLGMVSR